MKILIIVRAGKNSIHHTYMNQQMPDGIDFLISRYDESPTIDFDTKFSKYQQKDTGSKFGSIKRAYEDNKQLFNKYDFVWILDDDLYIPISSLINVHNFSKKRICHLFQPALDISSFASWPITVQNKKFEFRVTDFVEIMAPVISMELFNIVVDKFDENFTGSGFEWYWQDVLAKNDEYACILDNAPIFHTRQIGGGEIYTNIGGRSNSFLLEDKFLQKYNLTRKITAFYGVSLINDQYYITKSKSELMNGRDINSTIEPETTENFIKSGFSCSENKEFLIKLLSRL